MSRPRGRPPTSTSALVPAAARGETALGDVETILNAEAIEVFAKAVGGRDQLADTLAIAGTGSEIERITTLLLDPRYRDWSLARLCTDGRHHGRRALRQLPQGAHHARAHRGDPHHRRQAAGRSSTT